MENWIKNNLVLSGVILAFILYFTYNEFLAKPDNYEDCVLEVVKNAKTRGAMGFGQQACYDKFNPKFDPNKPYTILPKGLTPIN